VDTMGCETLAQEHSSPRVRAQIQGLPTWGKAANEVAFQ
jgi:hypothetical protein